MRLKWLLHRSRSCRSEVGAVTVLAPGYRDLAVTGQSGRLVPAERSIAAEHLLCPLESCLLNWCF